MNFLERMSSNQIRLLLQEMSISRKENIQDLPFSVIDGVLHVTHGRTEYGIIESIYREFEVIKLYNSNPSNYDQKRYHNYMSILLDREGYRPALIAAQEAEEKRAAAEAKMQAEAEERYKAALIAAQEAEEKRAAAEAKMQAEQTDECIVSSDTTAKKLMDELPYCISDNSSLERTDEQIFDMKANYTYLYEAITHIVVSIKRGVPCKKIGGLYRHLLLTGRLPKGDDVTGIDTHDLAKRLRCLIIYLSLRSENVEKFKTTYLYNNILYPIASGKTKGGSTIWRNYERLDYCEDTFADKNAYDGVLYCYKHRKVPIGINFARFMKELIPEFFTTVPNENDTNVKNPLNDDIPIDIKLEMDDAIDAGINMLKNIPRFRRNYVPKE